MNKIENFLSEVFGEVRALNDGKKIWLHANDVMKILQYSEGSWATKVSRLRKDGVTKCKVIDSLGREQMNNFIDEPNFYKLVFSSKMDKAEEFSDWICQEVIPAIRKTGGFVEDLREEEFINNYFPSFSEDVKLAMVQDLRKQNEALKPKAEKFEKFLDSGKTYCFTDVAKLISTKATEEGLDIKISNQKLTELLREKGILTKDKIKKGYKNNPRVGYEDYFNVIAVHNKEGEILSKTQTRVKSNGVDFIYNLVKESIKY